jgi:hypothetical protein
MRIHPLLKALVLGVAVGLFAVSQVRADELYGRIRGTVIDATGGVVPGAVVKAACVETGVSKETKSAEDGTYAFLQLLAPATYVITAEHSGFRAFSVSGIHLDVNQVYVQNMTLEVGTMRQVVTVEANTAQVETTSIQLGTTIAGTQIVDMPLVGRNWIALQQLEPGVVAQSDARGNYSTNGSQTAQNSFLVNGNDTNDLPLNTALVVPSPDAIGEFRMVTNTINPEYGRNSGAILNAIVKSGGNKFHGDGFDFFRDTSLNSRNFFSVSPSVFHQNVFGGTVGGPIWKDHTFFFVSYQGSRFREPSANGGGLATVFTSDQRNGIFPDVAACTTTGLACQSPFPMVGEDGNTYPAGTSYATLFPTGSIPSADLNPIAKALMDTYVPQPNLQSNEYSFNPLTVGKQDQLLTRVDYNIGSKDLLWGYLLWQRNPTTDDTAFTAGNLPGFADIDRRHTQQETISWTHTFSPSILNEVRLGYTRFNFDAVEPLKPVLPSSAGFDISPQDPAGAGLPLIGLTGYFTLGFSNNGPQPRLDQTKQFIDNFTWNKGKHTIKIGTNISLFYVDNPFYGNNNGNYGFGGAGTYSTGDPGADFLLGIPDTYAQGTGDTIDARAREYYAYAQDQYKIRPNFTLTFGVGWSVDTPIDDIFHNDHAATAFRAGQQSTVFPNAPTGYVFNGDAGVHAYGVTHYKNFGPRVGFAYSPNWGPLTGGAGKTSIRAGIGIYFNRSEEETLLQFLADPPYGLTSYGATNAGGSPGFANPFQDISGNTSLSISNPFPAPTGPPPTVQFGEYLPLDLSIADPNLNDPYAENWNFTIERQLPGDTILSLGYVGSSGHRLMLESELNPPLSQAACAANATCVADRVIQGFVLPTNFAYDPTVFASLGNIETVGNSNYNAFQVNVDKRLSHGLQLTAAYTWAHGLDNASGFENAGFGGGGFGQYGASRSINPYNHEANYGSSIYDATHRFVASYIYNIPSIRHFDSFHWAPSRLVEGWRMTGITTFQSGFPLDVVDSQFLSLSCWAYTYYGCADSPNVVSSPQYANPRTSSFVNSTRGGTKTRYDYWFNPNTFAVEGVGTFGNAGRNMLRGPGLNNFDFSFMKDTNITSDGSKRLELRFEFYNLFNHTQFSTAGVSTNIASSNFGRITAAYPSRIVQLAAKLYF